MPSKESLAAICSMNPFDPRCPRPREQQVGGFGGGGGGAGVTGRGSLQLRSREAPVVNVDQDPVLVPPNLPDGAKKETKGADGKPVEERAGTDRAIEDRPLGEPLIEELPSEAANSTFGGDVRRITRFRDDVTDFSAPTETTRTGGILDDDLSSSLRSLQYRPSGVSEFGTAQTLASDAGTEATVVRSFRGPRTARTMRPSNEVERTARPVEESTDVSEQPTVVGEEGRTFQRGAELPRSLPRESLERVPDRARPFGSSRRDIMERRSVFNERPGNFRTLAEKDPEFFGFPGHDLQKAKETEAHFARLRGKMTDRMISERGGGYTEPSLAEDNKGFNFFDGEHGFNPPQESADPVVAVGGTEPVADIPAPTITEAPPTIPEQVAGGGGEFAGAGEAEALEDLAFL